MGRGAGWCGVSGAWNDAVRTGDSYSCPLPSGSLPHGGTNHPTEGLANLCEMVNASCCSVQLDVEPSARLYRAKRPGIGPGRLNRDCNVNMDVAQAGLPAQAS